MGVTPKLRDQPSHILRPTAFERGNTKSRERHSGGVGSGGVGLRDCCWEPSSLQIVGQCAAFGMPGNANLPRLTEEIYGRTPTRLTANAQRPSSRSSQCNDGKSPPSLPARPGQLQPLIEGRRRTDPCQWRQASGKGWGETTSPMRRTQVETVPASRPVQICWTSNPVTYATGNSCVDLRSGILNFYLSSLHCPPLHV